MNFKQFLKENYSEGDRVFFQDKEWEVLEVHPNTLKLVDLKGKEIVDAPKENIQSMDECSELSKKKKVFESEEIDGVEVEINTDESGDWYWKLSSSEYEYGFTSYDAAVADFKDYLSKTEAK